MTAAGSGGGQSSGAEPRSAFELHPIGTVQSDLADRDLAPKQGDEGAPEAWLVFDDELAEALADLAPGEDVFVLTWLHLARRDKLRVRPRSDPTNPVTGVFSTRSPDRPNPIGLHRVRIVAVDGTRLRVSDMEAVDGTPIVDIKPALKDDTAR
jgi:tRNA-Thr(GGU) m(6)t(6)A37 methyltransferase TsaA